MSFTLTLWTNEPDKAAWADAAGIDRIGLDLETLGKADRQRGLPTWLSPHVVQDFDKIRPHVTRAELFARCNPFHPVLASEIETLLAQGVKALMLPNFTTAAEVEACLEAIGGRAVLTPLIERRAAAAVIPELASLGIRDVHVGLNDLSIDLGYRNRLAVLLDPLMHRVCDAAMTAGLKIGVGGLGRVDDDDLPTPSDLVYAQHARLGSSGALLARSFFSREMSAQSFNDEIARMRQRLAHWAGASAADIQTATVQLAQSVGFPTT
ncbi:hypothetical protein ASG17_12775 [Brevundimonas sp. Leaf363]|uniref:hypothetical protein n=1 Tax=Brevundimonas sp. Leaf363 TaxID=1736353 RepID=UPI000700B80A|nr:hypothetical protein [Brevundimonas sp. Leaf363]KQS53834.1 hypothetical protein ASG17_12775 [Brevundimonas sp. Leaf363]